MLYALIGVISGVIIGAVLPFSIPVEYSRYTAVAVLAILDSIIGALASQAKKDFNLVDFITGLTFYMFLAVFFVYIGDKLNIDIYLGVIVVFMFRIMQNIEILRAVYFKKFIHSKEDREA